MSRYPWRSRAALMALVNAAAGAAIAFGVGEQLGGEVETLAVAAVDLAATVGIVRSGEKKTTPVADPHVDNPASRDMPDDEIDALFQ